MSSQKGLHIIKTFREYMRTVNGHEAILEKVAIISGGHGNCQAEFTVDKEHLNGGATLHGGYIATLVDTISTFAMLTNEKNEMRPGVSIDLHVSFYKGAKQGEQVIIDAKTMKAGKSVVFLEVELKDKLKGVLLAKGLHTKFIPSE